MLGFSGKTPKEKSAIAQGAEMKGSFATEMQETAPTAVEMPSDISETGMMMGI